MRFRQRVAVLASTLCVVQCFVMKHATFLGKRIIAATIAAMTLVELNAAADEAPTILIEDVILTCTAQAQSSSMPSTPIPTLNPGPIERTFHARIARLCQGQTVCRIAAAGLLTPELRNSTCEDVVIVPVCAVGAFENVTPWASTEMALPLSDDGYLVINCSGRANPHF